MKKVLSACLLAGALFGTSLSAEAIDFKAKGMWDFNFEWQKSHFIKEGDGNSYFSPKQRLRTQIDIIASESLKGVVYFELGKAIWGRAVDGASLGTDGKIVKLRYSYIDWVIPNTDITVRMGLQPFVLPGYVAGSTILDDDGAGITVSAAFNENVGVSLFWMRAEHNNFSTLNASAIKDFKSSSLDVVGLTLPVNLGDVKLTPWGMYGFVGRKSLFGERQGDIEDLRAGLLPVLGPVGYDWGSTNPFGELPSKRRGNAFWVGLAAEYGGSSPLHIAVDGAYGKVDVGNLGYMFFNEEVKKFDLKRAGWYASLLAEYRFDYVTPGLMFWYSSGDNNNQFDGSERLPTIYGNWSATSFGYSGSYGIGKDSVIGNTVSGTWGALVQLKDLSFVENLSHVIRGARFQGTNDKLMPERSDIAFLTTIHDTRGGDNMIYLTKKDHAWEVDFDTEYKIYKDLSMVLELSFIRLELDKKIWSVMEKTYDKNAYRAGLNMRYSF